MSCSFRNNNTSPFVYLQTVVRFLLMRNAQCAMLLIACVLSWHLGWHALQFTKETICTETVELAIIRAQDWCTGIVWFKPGPQFILMGVNKLVIGLLKTVAKFNIYLSVL